MIATQFPILIVEDDMKIFTRMERNLSTHATGRDINIVVHHTTSLVGAKIKTRAYRPYVISTDMTYLQHDGDKYPLNNVGLSFLAWMKRRPPTKILIYSGEEPGNIKERLLRSRLYPNESTLPLVLQKSYAVSDDQWSRAVLDLLMSR
jgi:hypothetical protein